MWIGIPYTGYGRNVNLPVIPRMLLFCCIAGLLYFILSLPQTMRTVGNFSGFSKFDDKDSDDIYYLNVLHGIVYGIVMFVLLKMYNPYLMNRPSQNKIV